VKVARGGIVSRVTPPFQLVSVVATPSGRQRRSLSTCRSGCNLSRLPAALSQRPPDRWEDSLFLGYYAAHTISLILAGSGHAALPLFSTAMLFFVIPLTSSRWRQW
jgi:hypothetical protein